MHTSEYSIDINEITGKMKIEIPEDSKADEIQNIIHCARKNMGFPLKICPGSGEKRKFARIMKGLLRRSPAGGGPLQKK